MSEHVMGIEVGNSNIKMIEVSRKGAMLVVHNFSILPTPKDAISNGTITNHDAIKGVIAAELSAKKFKAKRVVNVVQSSNIIIRNITMDKQPEKIIKEILDMKIEDYLPVERSQYQVDFKILREFQEDEKDKYELLLVAAPNSVIEPMAALMKSLKLIPILINIPSECIYNVFGMQRKLVYDSSESVLVLDIGGRSSTVTIVTSSGAALTRYIDFGVDNINEAVEQETHRSSLLDKKTEEDDIFDIIRPHIEYNIISEVERILQFYYSSFGSSTLKKIYLVGGGASIKGIRGYVKDALNIPTQKLTEYNTVSEAPNLEFEPYRRFFVNILGAINGL